MADLKKPSQAKIPKPPSKTMVPKKSNGHTSKPSLSELKPLQFRVPADMHKDVKAFAVDQGVSMTEMFIEMYGEYKDSRE